jgi:hypothetical protein
LANLAIEADNDSDNVGLGGRFAGFRTLNSLVFEEFF